MSDFEIATYAEGVGGLTALDQLTTSVDPDPQFFFEPFAQYVRLGNGTYRGVGPSAAEWKFPRLSLDQRNQLAEFCTGASSLVYINTPAADGTFTVYLAVMRLPETEPAVKADFLFDYLVRFESLVEQVIS